MILITRVEALRAATAMVARSTPLLTLTPEQHTEVVSVAARAYELGRKSTRGPQQPRRARAKRV